MTTAPMITSPRWLRRIATPVMILGLAGCASIPADLGRSDVDELVAERGHSIGTDDTATVLSTLVTPSLTADDAVRIALINNPELQAKYAELGFAAADAYEAGRIRNPILSSLVLSSNRPGELDQVSLGLVTSFTDFVTLPARKRLAAAEYAAVKQHIGAAVRETAADAESAYYHFVGAKQVAALRSQIAKAAGLSVALAERYYEAGNLTPREISMERATAAEARLEALAADAEAYEMRSALGTVMGLSVSGPWDAPAQLPVPLASEDSLDELLALAAQSRLDLAAARADADRVADQRGVTGWTRWLGDLDIGVESERETDGARLKGPLVEWEVPLFTQNRDEILRLDADLQIAIAEVRKLTLAVSNDVHLAYAKTENARARVNTYRDTLVPARIAVTARAKEEEAFMLIGIFELLETKQQEYDAYQGYLEVVRDYWLARSELTRAVGNTLPSTASIGKERLDVEKLIQPQGDGDHSQHNMQGDMKGMQHDMKNGMKGMQHDAAKPGETEPPNDEHAGHGNRKPDGESQ